MAPRIAPISRPPFPNSASFPPAEPAARGRGNDAGTGLMRTRLAIVLAAVSLIGCAPVAAASLPPPSLADWRRGLDRLAALRHAAGGARTERLALALREPHTGRVLSARGAVAVAPPRALRMILLGPGGTTALDLWMSGARFRFAVPAIDLVARGDLGAPHAGRRGLPVDFLGWWLLRPAGGALLWTARVAGGDRFVLRDGEAVVDFVAFDDGRVEARRATWIGGERVDDERISAARMGCAPVRYHQGSTGLDVTVTCEGEAPGDPPARALGDPDEGAR